MTAFIGIPTSIFLYETVTLDQKCLDTVILSMLGAVSEDNFVGQYHIFVSA